MSEACCTALRHLRLESMSLFNFRKKSGISWNHTNLTPSCILEAVSHCFTPSTLCCGATEKKTALLICSLYKVNEYLTSAPTDQATTTNKDEEQQGGDSQSNVAVIAGLCSSFVLIYLAFGYRVSPTCLHLHDFFWSVTIVVFRSSSFTLWDLF